MIRDTSRAQISRVLIKTGPPITPEPGCAAGSGVGFEACMRKVARDFISERPILGFRLFLNAAVSKVSYLRTHGAYTMQPRTLPVGNPESKKLNKTKTQYEIKIKIKAIGI